VTYVPAIYNWQPVLSMPYWDPMRAALCEPRSGGRVLSVVHLAGRNKRDVQRLRTTEGGSVEMALTYDVRRPGAPRP